MKILHLAIKKYPPVGQWITYYLSTSCNWKLETEYLLKRFDDETGIYDVQVSI